MDQKAKRIPNNRPLNVLAHFGITFYFLHIKDTALSHSFYSSEPYYFYIYCVILFLEFHFYYLACITTSWATKSPDNVEGLFYCEECKIYVPCRASHCKHCKRCVLRRDHHCPWTGCCIGRDNHLYFINYLIFESLLTGSCLFDLIRTIFRQNSPVFYTITHYDFLILLPVIIFTFLQSFLLLISHIGLIIQNETTWESVRHFHISYLKKYPTWYSPFSLGIIGNIIEFCTMSYRDIYWDVPPSPEDVGLHFDPKYFPLENSDDFIPSFKKKKMPSSDNDENNNNIQIQNANPEDNNETSYEQTPIV